MEPAPIVIGYDGSEFATEAMRKGLWLAHNVGAPALVLRAWSLSNAPRPKSWTAGYVPPVEEFEATVLEQLQAAVEPLLAEFPGVEVRYAAPHGAAGRELLRASEGAQVLVVGTRGLGGFAGLLLGSVTGQLVEHAACDVLVCRRRTGDQSPERSLRLDEGLTSQA